MTTVTINDIIKRVDSLPEIPQVVLQVSQMLEDPDIDAEELAEVIRVDANLTSQMLRLCNSAAYGFSRRITTVKEAVAILGFKTLKSMVYTILAHHTLSHDIPGYALERGALWENGLTGAVYAKYLAEKTRSIDPDHAFTGAILRDIGKLVMGEFVGVNYRDIEALTRHEQIDFIEAENRVVGFNHTIVGKQVAEKWKLPDLLTQVIHYHHQPSRMNSAMPLPTKKLVTVVHLADVFTMMVGRGIGGDGLMYTLDYDAVQANLGIHVDIPFIESTMAALVELNKVIQELTEMFGSQD